MATMFHRELIQPGSPQRNRNRFYRQQKQPKARPVKPSIPKAPAPNLQEIADEVRESDLEAVAANLGLDLDRAR